MPRQRGALADGALLVLLSAARIAAAACASADADCGAGRECGDGPDVELLQHAAAVAHKAPLQQARLLTTLRAQPSFDGGKSVTVRGVVPVFPPDGGGYIAFVLDYDKDVWAHLSGNPSALACAPKDGPAFLSPIEAFGGNVTASIAFSMWNIVLKCAWPRERRHQSCHDVNLVATESAAVLASYRPCHDPQLAQEAGPYEMAACVEPVQENANELEASGIMMLPQWLEYSVQRGVQHFFVYNYGDEGERYFSTLRPYLDIGMMTQIRLTVPFTNAYSGAKTQQLVMHDCMHRMRGRAKWLMNSVDLDEYNVFPGFASHVPFHKALASEVGDAVVHAVSYGRINFLHPQKPYEELQVSSRHRATKVAKLCPKFFVRPDLVESLFVHWPTSWASGSRNLMLPRQRLIAHHYHDKTNNVTVVDDTLASQTQLLDEALRKRYGLGWSSWAAALQPPMQTLALAGGAVDLGAELEAQISEAHALATYLASLTEPTFIEERLR